jgi:hypothetical protein
MIRTLGGIVAGVAAAITIIMITEAIGNQIAPAPARVEITDIAETPPLPLMTLLFPVIGWLLGALVGGFVAIRISDQAWTAWAVAGAVLAATIFNFILMVYPLWVIILGLIMPIAGGWLAQRICALADSRR